jgi:hypothetical protein
MTLSTAFSEEDLCFRIYCESHGRVAIAGPRILRGGPHPDVSWTHETAESAEADAAKLRTYFAALPKQPSKAKLRKQGAD